MTIPASGQFSFSDFNVELGRSPTAELSSTDTALLTLAGISLPVAEVIITTSTFTPVTLSTTGLTQVTTAGLTGSADDGYWTVALPFNITYQGTSYSSVYIGTNSYITFGSGANNYSGLGPAVPSYPKIMIGSADNSGTSIWKGQSGSTPNRTYTVQFYGYPAASAGGSIISWQVVFSEANPGQFTLSVTPANLFRAGAISGFYTSNTLVRSWNPSINTGLIYTQGTVGSTTFSSFSMTTMRGKSGRFVGVNQRIVYTRYLGETGQVTVFPFPITVGQSISPHTWSISPELPLGSFIISSNGGVVIGQPTALLSSSTYSMTVTDSSSPVALTTSSGPNALVLTVLYRDLQVYTEGTLDYDDSYNIYVRANASGLANQYNSSNGYYAAQSLYAIRTNSDGIPPVNFSISPALIAGLTSSNSTGTGLSITGKPGDIPAQVIPYTLTATDGYPRSVSKTLNLHVVISNIFVRSSSNGVYVYLNTPHSEYPVIIEGGSGATTFSYTGTLPPGISYSSTGLLSGTPTSTAASTQINVTASNPATSSQAISFFNIISEGPVNYNKGWLMTSSGSLTKVYDMNTETSTTQPSYGGAYLFPGTIFYAQGQFGNVGGANSRGFGYVFGGGDLTFSPSPGTYYQFRRVYRLTFATQTQSYLGTILNREHNYYATVGSWTKSYMGGGYVDNRGDNVGYPTSNFPAGLSTTIESFTYSSETAALIGTSLTQARSQPRGVSSTTRGYWAGGLISQVVHSTVIDGITFSDESQRSVAATLNRGGYGKSHLNSSTKGYWAWGLSGSGYFNDIENFNFSNESRSIVATALSESIHYRNSMSRDTKGYLFGANNTYSLNFSTEAIATATAGDNGLFSNQVNLYQSDVA